MTSDSPESMNNTEEAPSSVRVDIYADHQRSNSTYIAAGLGALFFHAGIFLLVGSGFLVPAQTGMGEEDDDGGRIEVTLNDGAPEEYPAELENFAEDLVTSTEENQIIPEEVLEFTPPENEQEFLIQPTLPAFPDNIVASDLPNLPPMDLSTPLDFSQPKQATRTPRQTNKSSARNNSTSQGANAGNGGSGNPGAGQGTILPRYKSNPKPPYPSEARNSGKEGTVKVRISLDENGAPTHVSVVNSSGHSQLDQSAVQFIKARWKFHPAQKEGKNISWTVIVSVVFELEK